MYYALSLSRKNNRPFLLMAMDIGRKKYLKRFYDEKRKSTYKERQKWRKCFLAFNVYVNVYHVIDELNGFE